MRRPRCLRSRARRPDATERRLPPALSTSLSTAASRRSRVSLPSCAPQIHARGFCKSGSLPRLLVEFRESPCPGTAVPAGLGIGRQGRRPASRSADIHSQPRVQNSRSRATLVRSATPAQASSHRLTCSSAIPSPDSRLTSAAFRASSIRFGSGRRDTGVPPARCSAAGTPRWASMVRRRRPLRCVADARPEALRHGVSIVESSMILS